MEYCPISRGSEPIKLHHLRTFTCSIYSIFLLTTCSFVSDDRLSFNRKNDRLSSGFDCLGTRDFKSMRLRQVAYFLKFPFLY